MGKHKRITYSFMVAGHTKFSPDGFFGLFKLKLKNSEVDDLEDLVKVVESSTNGYNNAQTIYDGNGERKVFFYRWTEYLNNHKVFQSTIILFLIKKNQELYMLKKVLMGNLKL